MRYKVADLIKAAPGTSRWVELDGEDQAPHSGFQVLEPLRGRLQLMRDPSGVLVQGHLHSKLGLACSRCLASFAWPLDLDLCEHFRPTVAIPGGAPVLAEPDDEPEDITEIDAHQVLDLAGVIWQNIELALPAAVLCRPDCAGLCPQCGCDRNVEDCACQAPADPRWAALAALIETDRD